MHFNKNKSQYICGLNYYNFWLYLGIPIGLSENEVIQRITGKTPVPIF